MKRYILLFLLIYSTHSIFSQKGKDGAGNIIASTTINLYTSLTADAFVGNTTVNVLSSAGYAVGDLIYIIQMQGADVNCYINPWGNPNSAEPLSFVFGKITNYNNSGNNEYAQVSSVAGNVITIDCPLKNNYTAAGKVQVIKAKRYSSLTIGAAGIITCPAWNGTVGGVIALEVNGNTTINPTGKIDASATGFRGGVLSTSSFLGAGAWSHNNPQEGAFKGESIAGDVMTYSVNFQGRFCKGAVANGGGGANANNAGGGGGANAGDTSLYTGTGNPDISVAGYVNAWNLESAGFSASSSSGGGRGGYTFSNANLNPTTSAPGIAGWAGDVRRVQGGYGGRPLNYNTGRLFCGGGGGAGDQNDGYGGAGGRGGGIINMISYGTVSGGGQIISNGENGFNTNTTGAAPANNCNGRDGAGGAGGGGAIVVNSVGSINTLTLSAKGGNGGNQQMKSGFFATTSMAYGPGAGGGGGYIGTTAAAITTSVNGGINGIVQYLSGNFTSLISTAFPPNGATKGGSGTVASTLLVVPTITASPNVTICVNNSTNLTATLTGQANTIGWYSAIAGGSLLGTGSAFTTSVFTTPGTYYIFAGFCPNGIYRDSVMITVTNGPTLIPVSATVCAGQTGTVSVSGATTYTWSTGSNSPTITAAPLVTTVYTVTGAIGTCTTQTTSTITVNSSGSISATSSTICSGQNAILSAGAALSYSWSTGANTQTISVNPLTTTVYTVNATLAGGCIVTNTAAVSVNANPTLSPVSATICSGQSGTISASGATTYTWSTGATTSSISASPLITTTYTVIGANGTCTSSSTASITVSAIGSIAINSPTICSGQSAILTAGAALTYTWSTGANTPTVSVNPLTTTVYTLNANLVGGCNVTGTSTVTVNPNPILNVISATICAGQTGTVSASGATTYTWSTGSNSSSITASPIVNTTYTVIGSNGTCTSSATGNITVNAVGPITVNSATICSGQAAILTAGAATSYTWSTGANTQTVSVNPITTTVYTINATLVGGCVATNTSTVTVNITPTLTPVSASVCSGQSGTISASGATTYTWSTGATTSSISASPLITTTYTVIGANGTCTSSSTASITVSAIGSIAINSATICSGQSAILTAGAALTYTWSNGANTPTVSVNPLATTVYTLNANLVGGCNVTGTSTVTVNPNPVLNVVSATICAGQTGTVSASGATTYTWSTGSNSSSITTSPIVNTTYTVIGANGTCTSSTTGNITVNAIGPIAVNSATICSGQAAILTAGAATSYTWSNGANTQTVSVNPITTTVYTINATLAGGCVATNTATVTVNITPTLAPVSASVCSGQSGTISASGATTYIWSTGATTSSMSAAPLITTTYTVIGANGTCTSSSTASITVSAIGSIAINSSTICTGQSATLTAGAAASYTWSTGANTPSIIVTPTANTVYTLSATLAGGCNVIGSSTVTVNSNPILTALDATICIGQTGTISASGATTYTWNTGSNSSSITASPIVNTTYTVIGANGTCTTSATASITINTSGTISATSATICSGQTATVSAGAATSYTWSNGASTQNNLVNPLINSTYTVNATLAGGCIVSNTVSVTVDPNPTVTVNTTSICAGESTTLTAAGATSYLWNDGNLTATNILTPSVTTVYTVTGTTGNCSSTTTTQIFVTPTPTLSASSITVCAGQAATLTATGATSYTWDPFPGTNVVSNTFSASPIINTTYTVIGAVNSCTAMTTASITIGLNLSITINTIPNPATICSGQAATLTAISTATSYVWSNAATTASILVNPIANTSYTVTGSKGACTGTAVTNVNVNALPSLTVNANSICAGGTATISALGATSYSWSNGFINTSSITVTPLTNTSYTVIGEVGSCTIATIYNVTITPSPTITALNSSICNGATATLTANGATSYTWLPSGTQSNSVAVTPTVNTTYTVIGDNGSCSAQTTASVNVVNGLIAPVNNATICQGQMATIGTTLNGTSYIWSNGATTQSININPNSTTNYSVLVVAGSCSFTGNSIVTVIPTPTLLLSSSSICLGQVATLTAAGAVNGYTWNPGNLVGSAIAVNPTVTTNYVVTSANGICPATATTQIIVNTKPVLDFSPQDLLVCPNTPVTYSATGANIYEWHVNGVYHFGNPLTVIASQNSTITLVGSNGGCSTTTVTSLNISDVNATIKPESNYVDYPGNLTFTNTSTGASTIFWDFGNGQTSTNNTSTAYYELPGKYLVALVAKNDMGCMDTAYYVIEAGCGKGDFYIPNSFTPNGDGLNESFKVIGGSCVTQFKGSVFDRWGNEIFKWKNIEDTWDGTFKGKEVEIGVYNYLITYTLYTGKVFTKTGHISVIR